MDESDSKEIVKETIDNGVRIIEYSDGRIVFKSIDMTPKNQPINKSWWEKVKDWFSNSRITPYAKIRNLADPFGDKNLEGGGKSSVEVGIKIKF